MILKKQKAPKKCLAYIYPDYQKVKMLLHSNLRKAIKEAEKDPLFVESNHYEIGVGYPPPFGGSLWVDYAHARDESENLSLIQKIIDIKVMEIES